MENSNKAIVLRVSKFNEADLMIRALMQNGSVNDYIAKFGAKSKKRFGGGVLEPGNYVKLNYTSKNKDVHFLNEACLIDSFDMIRLKYEKIQYLIEALKIVGLSATSEIEQPDLFNLLGNYLKSLCIDEDSYRLFTHFKIRYYNALGILPSSETYIKFLRTQIDKSNTLKFTKEDLNQIHKEVSFIVSDYF